MKKTTIREQKRLALKPETVKALAADELGTPKGGMLPREGECGDSCMTRCWCGSSGG